MVLTFGTNLPHCSRHAIFLSSMVLDLKFSLSCLLTPLDKVALANCVRGHVKLPVVQVNWPTTVGNYKRVDWTIRNSADGRGLDPPRDSGDGRTRLIKTIQSLQIRLNTRIQDLRKDLPRKLLFFLVGFYCATAFATVIGQTGDWDILSAALAVAVVEGIGALMYKASLPLDRIRNLIVMFNYWKAGLTLGLFLDSFKYETSHS